MIRELSAVVDDQEAEMGILVLLKDPTCPMSTFADGSGFVPKSAMVACLSFKSSLWLTC